MNGNVDGEKAPAARTCVGNRYRFDTRPSPMAFHRWPHSRPLIREPKLLLLRSRLYTTWYALRIQNLRWKALNRAKPKRFPPSTCCGSMRGRHPLKTVLKPYWKPTWKLVNLHDTTPHEPRPGAPGHTGRCWGLRSSPRCSYGPQWCLGGAWGA
jgi:hypothetical protein